VTADEATPSSTPTASISVAAAVPATPPPRAAAVSSEPATFDLSSAPAPAANTPETPSLSDARHESSMTEVGHPPVPPAVGAGVGAAMGLAALLGTTLIVRRRHSRRRRTRSESDDEVR